MRKVGRQRSIPLHTIKDHTLENLESIINSIKEHTQLTIIYRGFAGQYWPSNYFLIQKMTLKDEDINIGL